MTLNIAIGYALVAFLFGSWSLLKLATFKGELADQISISNADERRQFWVLVAGLFTLCVLLWPVGMPFLWYMSRSNPDEGDPR